MYIPDDVKMLWRSLTWAELFLALLNWYDSYVMKSIEKITVSVYVIVSDISDNKRQTVDRDE